MKKKSQQQVITTILLILLAITAVVIVSGFVFRMIRDNLASTECFKTIGQVSINVEDGFTYYNEDTNQTFVSVERGQREDYNLTGLSITISSPTGSKAFRIENGKNYTNVNMYNLNEIIEIPNPNEKRTYIFNDTQKYVTGVNEIILAPIIGNGRLCEEADRKEIRTKNTIS